MTFAPASAITYRIKRAHEWALDVTKDLDDTSIGKRHATSPSIGFHLWHIARWTDRNGTLLQNSLRTSPGAEELWHALGLAKRWRMRPKELGDGETGMEMSDEASKKFAPPPRDELTDYVESVFEAMDAALGRLSDEQLGVRLTDSYGRETSVGEMLLNHLSHIDRHVGMIESLRGVEGLRGSATV